MRLIEGEFPDYRQVIPKESKRHVRVRIARTLLGALRRVSILSSERARGVKLRVENGMLEVATTNPDIGEAREELEADYARRRVRDRIQRPLSARRALTERRGWDRSRSGSPTR